MKTIITALNNQMINSEIRKNLNYNVVTRDISYQEGIFETLEKNDVDILLLGENIDGEFTIIELVNKLKNIKPELEIIVILEKPNKEVEEYLKYKGVHEIFYNNQVTTKEVLEHTQKKDEVKEISNMLRGKGKEKIEKNECKTISIIGSGSVGKSIFTSIAGILLSQKGKRVLIMDFDILNKSVYTLLGIKKFPEKPDNKKEFNEKIKKLNYRIHVLSAIDLLYDEKSISYTRVKNALQELKEIYDVILLDTSSECYFNINRKLINLTDTSIFLTDTNVLEIKKAQTWLNIYEKEWNIEKEKINIIFNKINNNSTDLQILYNLFNNYKILGKIELNTEYNNIINRNINRLSITGEIETEYTRITEKMIRNKMV